MPRNLIRSVLPLAVSILLFLFVGRFGIGKISEIRREITSASKDRTTLTEKLNLLNSIASEAESQSQIAVIALPGQNSSLTVFSQLKSLAAQEGIALSDMKTGMGTGSGGDIVSTGISFEAVGARQAIFSFITKVGTIAPLAIVDKVKLNESSGTMRATIGLKTFSAAFPTKLPSITQPISTLTADEKNILVSLDQLILPQFTQIPPASGGKADPFAQ